MEASLDEDSLARSSPPELLASITSSRSAPSEASSSPSRSSSSSSSSSRTEAASRGGSGRRVRVRVIKGTVCSFDTTSGCVDEIAATF